MSLPPKNPLVPFRACVAPVLMALLMAPAQAIEGAAISASAPCVAPAGICEDKADLTLATALRLAVDHNRDLAAAMREIDVRDGAMQQADRFKNPVVNAESEDLRRQERSTTLRVSQVIELGGKRSARVAASALAREAALQDYDLRRRALMVSVAQAFTDVVAAQKQRQLAHENIDLAERGRAAVARRVQAGKASPVDETKALLELASARIDAGQASRDEQAAGRRLSTFWGNSTPQFRLALGDLEETVAVPPLGILQERLRSSPAFLRTSAEIAQRQAALAVERANRAPDIAVTAGVRRFAQGGENGLLIGVSIPLPLFDRNQGTIAQAQQQVLQAQDLQQASDLRLMSDLAQTVDALATTDIEIRLLRSEVLPAARSVVEAASKGFDYGKFSFPDVLDARRSYVQQQRLYLRALAHRHRLAAEIVDLIAAPVTGSRDGAGSGINTTQ